MSTTDVEMWKIRFTEKSSRDGKNTNREELVESNTRAMRRVFELECRRLASEHLTHPNRWFRFSHWRRVSPDVTSETKAITRVSAAQLIDGKWVDVVWTLVGPSMYFEAGIIGQRSFADEADK